MLILLPGGQPHILRLPGIRLSFREAPLTGPLLAALVPPELELDVRYVDGSVSPIPLGEPFDLVAISVITGMAPRAYELAALFRARGATVILGGIHVTLLPDEAAQHADAIAVGYAETLWPRMLRDWVAEHLKPRYEHRGPPVLDGLPAPRTDLQKPFGYAMPRTVNATRGCRQQCDFCVAPAAPLSWATRPVGDVIADIRRLRGRSFVFHDLNLTDDVEYAKELFAAMLPLRRRWGGLVSTRVVRDKELLDLMARAGCSYLLIGFETVNAEALGTMRKRFNSAVPYADVVAALHARRIVVQGCFIFGLDEDTPEVFDATVDAIDALGIDIPRFALYTPFPGTAAFNRLQAEDRLLHRDWSFYDTQHTVIRPARMTPAELDAGFIRAWRDCYRLPRIARRLRLRRHPGIVGVGNLAYRLYSRKLGHDNNRFPDGVTT
ncbi:MAG: B12-binding domain-containing radical SAM protein [Kiritimatiellia bacterium]